MLHERTKVTCDEPSGIGSALRSHAGRSTETANAKENRHTFGTTGLNRTTRPGHKGSSEEALDKPVYQFYQAAALHRVYVLRDLLPEHGIVGD